MNDRAPVPFPQVTALRAQRLLGTTAFRIAPALAAALMAGGHLESSGRGLIVFLAILLASLSLDRERYPIQLMPLTGFVIRAFVPILGIAIALGTFALAGRPESVWSMAVPVIGAWGMTAIAAWTKARFETSRRVRVGVIGSAGLARGLDNELHNSRIRAYEVVGWIARDSPPAERGEGGPRRLGSLDQVR